ncbi:hypothetical protein DOTSEDRAFT_74964 [Dothistroma septosporum NZE10]|uniref:Uncharacterized protein n=1 Tax=Dothistroma septosporum (strain NZE10 / CBS 128990) TaxID=675120 RepID=N1PGA3_DOTSN|nr:hypothetical protein DOTSEDRAFT_74964 [Dothistroma septosporum NZE10]
MASEVCCRSCGRHSPGSGVGASAEMIRIAGRPTAADEGVALSRVIHSLECSRSSRQHGCRCWTVGGQWHVSDRPSGAWVVGLCCRPIASTPRPP